MLTLFVCIGAAIAFSIVHEVDCCGLSGGVAGLLVVVGVNVVVVVGVVVMGVSRIGDGDSYNGGLFSVWRGVVIGESLSLIGVGVAVSDARVNVELLIGVVMYVVVGVVVDIDVHDCGFCGGVIVALCV